MFRLLRSARNDKEYNAQMIQLPYVFATLDIPFPTL
jgi:hypothetical protein